MKPEQEKGPAVEVTYLNTNELVRFHSEWTDTLAQVWNKAYVELGEARKADDSLECHDGASMGSYLQLTLAELRDRHICQNRKFQIRCSTGGA